MATMTRHRIMLEITPHQRRVLTENLPYGTQNRLLQIVLDDIVCMLERFGYHFVIYLMERQFSYETQMRAYYDNRGLTYPTSSATVACGADEFDSGNSGASSDGTAKTRTQGEGDYTG